MNNIYSASDEIAKQHDDYIQGIADEFGITWDEAYCYHKLNSKMPNCDACHDNNCKVKKGGLLMNNKLLKAIIIANKYNHTILRFSLDKDSMIIEQPNGTPSHYTITQYIEEEN